MAVSYLFIYDLQFSYHHLHACTSFTYYYIQALDTGEEGHSTEYANKPEIKPLNRFANVVCK